MGVQHFRRIAAALSALALSLAAGAAAQAATVSVSFPVARSPKPLDGRIVLIVSPTATPEPRLQVELEAPLRSPFMFGQTVDGMAPGQAVVLGEAAYGWPKQKLSQLPPGDYTVQAVLNRYETFHRADGSVVKLPPDMGEGQHWNLKPGNLYSKPLKVHIGPKSALKLVLDQEIAPIQAKADTPYIKHIRIKSELLSRYWGRPVYLGAHVLLPEGFDSHPAARYPLMVFHGHFPDDIEGFRTTPPDPNLKPDYSERFHLAGYNRIQQEEAYSFYKTWTGKDFPRFLVIEIQHPTPYYDDSYAVNSANQGLTATLSTPS